MLRIPCYSTCSEERATLQQGALLVLIEKKKHLKFTPLKKKLQHTDRWEGAGIGGTLSLNTWTGIRVLYLDHVCTVVGMCVIVNGSPMNEIKISTTHLSLLNLLSSECVCICKYLYTYRSESSSYCPVSQYPLIMCYDQYPPSTSPRVRRVWPRGSHRLVRKLKTSRNRTLPSKWSPLSRTDPTEKV